MTYVLLLIGFLLLIKGADVLVNGASALAKRLRVSDLVIGLTIVAFGTSAPELFVNLFASLNGTTDIAIGNVIGSNIVNTLLILGAAAIICPLRVTGGTVWKEIPLSLLAGCLLLIMANDHYVDGSGVNMLTKSDGLAFIAFFLIFLYYTFGIARHAAAPAETVSLSTNSVWGSIGRIVIGLVGLVVGGRWIVDGATEIALQFGLSDALIGLTIVAIGTSLPELATSVVAASKKNTDIAVGNVVGSNIFNIFWILGISAFLRPLPFTPHLNVDIAVVIGASVLLFVWMFIGKRFVLERWQGVIFVLLYMMYNAFIVVRG